MISEGCTVIGPTLSQFWLPLTAVPVNSTSTCGYTPTNRIGNANAFQERIGNLEATVSATAPIVAKTAWLMKIN